MSGYYQRSVMERTGMVAKDRVRCDGAITVRGVRQACRQVLAEVKDPKQPTGRNEVVCRRCGKRHII